MRYELWEFDGGHSFIDAGGDEAVYLERVRQMKIDEPDARLAWTVEAGSWNEAMQALYDRKGWGRYRPLEEELGETAAPPSESR